MKSQAVRLVDVLILGPFMVSYALSSMQTQRAKTAMLVSGLLTISYNLDNFLKARK